eukprot:c7215_g1_i1 orf=428-721(-)
MACPSQGHYLNIQTQPYKSTQLPHVSKEETPKACIFTTNVSGYNVEDVQVQVEDDQALILRFGKATRKFDLPPNACLEEIEAKWKEGILIITIPKMA